MPLDAGTKTVTTSGTPVALAASTRIGSIVITALAGNTKAVWVGGEATVSASGKKGTPLLKGESVRFNASIDKVDDLASVWLDSEVNGEGVGFSYGHMP
jgi:hypothetical protein